MAIKGLTDKRPPMLPRLAKIRLGVRRSGQSGNEFPADVDYFVCTDAPEVEKVFGEKPKKLVAMFASDDPEVNFPTRLEAWKASKSAKMPDGKTPKSVLFCASDGEIANRIYVGDKDAQGHAHIQTLSAEERPDLNEMFSLPCPYQVCPYYQSRNCREVGRLNIVLPQVSWSGIYQIETSSLWAFGNIRDTVAWMQAIYGGRIAFKPFELTRNAVVMTPPELKGKSVVKHVLHLRIIDKHNLPEIPPPPFMQQKLLVETAADHPEDLFPPVATRAGLPPIPGLDDGPPPVAPAAPVEKDELTEMAEVAGLGPAEWELFKAKHGGDVSKIRRALNQMLDGQDKIQKAVKTMRTAQEKPAKAEPQEDLFGGTPTEFDF